MTPSDFSETVEAAENGVSRRVASVNDGAALPSAAKVGVAASEKPCRLRIVVRNSRRKAGNFCSEASRSAPRSALACGGGARVGEEAGDVGAFARERLEDLLGVGGELGQLVALAVEDAEQAVDVAQRRVGALDRRLDVGAAAGQAGAEFVEDQAEALRVGKFVDVVDQVGVDAGAVVARAAAGTGRRRAGRRGPASTPAPAGEPGARGTVGRQSTNFSPISDCGRIRQLASLRKSWKPGSVIFITITALPEIAFALPSS